MLCCPTRSPFKASRRLPGGTRRSPSRSAISSWRSFRRATAATFTKRLTLSPRASAAVSAHWDADPPTVIPDTILPSAYASTAAVMTSTNRVYVGHFSYLADFTLVAFVREHEEGESTPVPLPVSITTDPILPGDSVTVHFAATSGFDTPLPIQQIYYQLDSVDDAWSETSPAGPSASATLALAPGAHTIHAFAVDGQEAAIGWIQHANPIVGPVASVEVTVPPPPACSNGLDDDGDGGTDWDGGALGLTPDAQCIGKPGRDREVVNSGGCGLGAEIALALAVLARRRFGES